MGVACFVKISTGIASGTYLLPRRLTRQRKYSGKEEAPGRSFPHLYLAAMAKPVFHIIGGGPVGFAASLFLAREGFQSVVYESRSSIPVSVEESYPIGINPRALEALSAIDPELAETARKTGRVVDSWQIFGGKMRVAKLDSGVVFGTSRGKVNLLLYEWAQKNRLIDIKFNHKLVDVEFESRTLVLERRDTMSTMRVQADRVLAADGLYSMVRRKMEQKCPGFRADVTKWTNEFRVLFGKPGDLPETLDTKAHFIFNGLYAATVDNQGQQQWTLVMGARDDLPDKDKDVILGKEPTAEKMRALRGMIDQKAPLVSPLIDDAELTGYFSRRTYRGAIVKVNRLNHEEWLCLLGDSAHSVLPAVGEGINSGLEDCMELHGCLRQGKLDSLFHDFNASRLPDMHGIGDYALYLNEIPCFSGEKAARGIFMVTNGMFSSKTINNLLFGPEGAKRTPYRDIIKSWKLHKLLLLNLARLLAYPFAAVAEIIWAPITVWFCFFLVFLCMLGAV